eukprot:scaffold51615_cov19-Prasinocladus_malaysianus.AAC.2
MATVTIVLDYIHIVAVGWQCFHLLITPNHRPTTMPCHYSLWEANTLHEGLSSQTINNTIA